MENCQMMKYAKIVLISLMVSGQSVLAGHRADMGIAGDVDEIRSVISGKECKDSKGNGVIKFGASTAELAGTFDRAGKGIASYQIGYASLLIKRHGKIHSHVATVSRDAKTLHLSADVFRC